MCIVNNHKVCRKGAFVPLKLEVAVMGIPAVRLSSCSQLLSTRAADMGTRSWKSF